jgi:hypothetical protein
MCARAPRARGNAHTHVNRFGQRIEHLNLFLRLFNVLDGAPRGLDIVGHKARVLGHKVLERFARLLGVLLGGRLACQRGGVCGGGWVRAL